MRAVVGTFLGGDGRQGGSDGRLEPGDGPRGGLPQAGLEFGKGLLTGIEIRRVGGQEDHLGARLFNSGPGGCHLMRWQIVEDDAVARPEGGDEDRADIGAKGAAVEGAVEEHRCREAPRPHPADQRSGFPMAVRNRGPTPVAAGCPPTPPGQRGGGGGLIQEDELGGIELGLPSHPSVPLRDYVRSLLLAGRGGLFLKGSRCRR